MCNHSKSTHDKIYLFTSSHNDSLYFYISQVNDNSSDILIDRYSVIISKKETNYEWGVFTVYNDTINLKT